MRSHWRWPRRPTSPATAKEHASAIITLNDEIDQHLIKLRELFERRFSVLSQLSATAVVDQSFIVKLQGKSGPTRALCAAGLAKYVSVEKVATQSYVSLASVNPILLGIGRDAGVPPGRTTNGGDASNSVPRHRRTEVIP